VRNIVITSLSRFRAYFGLVFNNDFRRVFLLACLVFSLLGCADSPFEKDPTDLTIQFTIEFNSAPDFSTYDYYIIMAKDNKVTVSTDVSGHYFLSPGIRFDPTLLEDLGESLSKYYSAYFSTWMDYIIISSLHSNTPALYQGPFSSTTNTETKHLSFLRSDNF
jgi:hypothetical protein